MLSQEVYIELPMRIYVDNTASVKYATNDLCSEKTRHWDIALKYINEKYGQGLIQMLWVEGSEQRADILTKALSREPFEKHRTSFGIY